MANKKQTLITTKINTRISTVILVVVVTLSAYLMISNLMILTTPAFPTAIIKTSAFGTSGLAPFTILFNAKDSIGDIVRYEWNFSDSNNDYLLTDEGRLVGHRFDNPGTYNVQLTTYDSTGQSASSQITITALSHPNTAKTYYLSSDGDDINNDGLSQSTPLKTIAKLKTIYNSIPAGSQILFRRGDSFDTLGDWNLNINSDNSLFKSAPNYITINAYGSGADPIIFSSASVNLALINTNEPYPPTGIILENLDVRGSIWIRPKYDSASEYFKDPGIQATLRHLKARSITMWESQANSFEDVYIDNNQLSVGLGTVGLDASEQPGYTYLNKIEVTNALSHCVYFSGGINNALVENSKLHDCGRYPASNIRSGFTTHGFVDNLTLRNNEIYHNGFAIGIDANIGYPDILKNVVVEDNKIYNQVNFVFQLASIWDLVIRNNLIYDNPGTNQPVFYFRNASTAITAKNLQIYNNTLSGNSAELIKISGTVSGTEDIHFKNNNITYLSGSKIPILNDERSYQSSKIRNYLDFKDNTYSGFSNTAALFVSPIGSLNLPNWLKYESDGTLPSDGTAPITSAFPAGGTYSSSQNITLTANEPATIYYCLSSGCTPQTVYSSPVSIAIGGLNTLRYFARDTALNTELTKEAIYTINITCLENWFCASWTTCSSSGIQTRTCTDSNSCGTTATKPATTQSCTPPATAILGTGLKGSYYNNKNFTNRAFSRTDQIINFNWGTGSPDSRIASDTFSIRWAGKIQVDTAGTYTFYLSADDGFRLWIDGQLIINKLIDQPQTEWSGTIPLTVGKHNVRIDYYENTINAAAIFSWSGPGINKQVVPPAKLFLK